MAIADRCLCHLGDQGLRVTQKQILQLAAAIELILQALRDQAVCVAGALHDGVSKTAYASVGPDPAGDGFQVVCVAIRESGRGASA
jgi:fructose-1-phosphate kinase PfkB-like protein